MTNKALNKLRRALDSSYREITAMVMEIVDQAIAHAVEEATSQPQHQCAVQQARLMRAKADLLELQVAERRRAQPDLFYDPVSGNYLDSEGNVVEAPECRAVVQVADALETLASEFAGLQREVHKMAREAGHDVARSVGAYCAEAGGGGAGVAMGVSSGTQTVGGGSWQITPKRLKGRAWVEDAKRRRDAGVPLGDIIRDIGREADLEAAELRGFYKGRGKALEIVFAERNKWTTDLVRDALAKVSEAICYMQKDG